MTEAKLEITNLITPFIKLTTRLSDEWKNLFDIGLREYLFSQTEKYYFTNTFLHRGDKVVFNEIYYPIKAIYKKFVTDFKDLNHVFETYKNITIIGSAGSGKTTLMKYIFLNSIKTKSKIPILIELRYLNQYNGDFEKLICEKVLSNKVKPSEDIFKRSLQSGHFLFLLDGYDEIFSDKKQELNRQIELFVDSYSKNNFFITTRPGSGIENFPRFHDFKVLSLTNEDVKGFIDKIVAVKERASRILSIIHEQKNDTYLEYLRNPLLLSMFILAFESHPQIPSRKSSFYRNVFDTLYSKHDGITKNSFPREKLTKFEREDFESILNVFSYITTITGQYSFTNEDLTDALNKAIGYANLTCNVKDLVYDLQTTISILILDGFEYYFPHRSMQEYFTAQFIANLPSEKKPKAYENLQEVLIKLTSDYSFHLCSMCQELDESAFTANFLVPSLKAYEESILLELPDIEILDNYFDVIGASIYYGPFADSKDHSKQMVIFSDRGFYVRLCAFCKVYNHSNIFFFPEHNPSLKLEILRLHFGNKKQKGSGEIKITNIIKEMLIDCGIVEIIKSIKKSIPQKINDLEKNIQSNKKRIDDILNI